MLRTTKCDAFSEARRTKTPFYGTEYAFGAQKGFLGYATHFQKNSVLKIAFYGTERAFGA